MNERRGVSVIVLGPIIARVAALGGDADTLRAALGIDASTSADAFVPAERLASALRAASSLSGEAFALLLVTDAPVGSFGVLDYLLMASGTLREALGRLQRLYILATQLVRLEVEEEGDIARMAHRLEPGITRVPELTEYAFAALVVRLRLTLGAKFRVRRVQLTHAKDDPEPFRKFFGAPVEFGADCDVLELSRSSLDTPFATSDPTTAAFLQEQSERLLSRIDPPGVFLDDVRGAIVRTLRDGGDGMASVARKLGKSTRTLQRELHAHGTSLRALVADVRRERALELLATKRVSLLEIALELGFSDQASFHHAFKRWTGHTPGSWRG